MSKARDIADSAATINYIDTATSSIQAQIDAAGAAVERIERTSNTIIGNSDSGNLIVITSGAFTQTFDAAATLGSGWFCYIKNTGEGDITLDPNGAETIDGLTSFILYPEEARLIQSDGTNLNSVVLNPFYKRFTASGTFTKPPGYSGFTASVLGAGGAGGGGGVTSGRGGNGGAGGSALELTFRSADLSATETVTVGAGGTSTSTTNGTDGGDTTFASLVGYGGGGGAKGDSYAVAIPASIGGGIGGTTAALAGHLYHTGGGGYAEWAGAGKYQFTGNNSAAGAGTGSLFGGASGGAGQLDAYAGGNGGRSRSRVSFLGGAGGTPGNPGGDVTGEFAAGGGGSGARGGHGGYGSGGGGGGCTAAAVFEGGNGGDGLVDIWGLS